MVSHDNEFPVGDDRAMSLGPRPTRLLAGCGAAVGVAAGVLGLVLHLGFAEPPHAAGVTDWWPMGVVAGLAFGPTGGWLASRRPEHPLGWLLLLLGVLNGVSLTSTDYGLRALAHDWPLAAASLWVGNWVWVLGLVPIASVVPLLVPDGHLPSRRGP